MYSNYFGTPFAGSWGVGIGFVFALLVIWSLAWKGLALWKSARLGHKWWFVALMIINTAGILEILYIYIFSKKTRMRHTEPAVEHHHERPTI